MQNNSLFDVHMSKIAFWLANSQFLSIFLPNISSGQ